MDDAAVLREQAAETLRSVEGMRRRAIAAGGHRSFFAPLMYALAAMISGLVAYVLSGADPVETSSFSSGTSTQMFQSFCVGAGCEFKGPWIVPTLVICASLLGAFIATEVHYRRQPVHPAAPPRKQRSTGDMILIAILIVVFGPMLLGLLFTLVTFPLLVGPTAAGFIFFTIAGLVQAKRTRNAALAIAAGVGLLAVGLAPFVDPDHETAMYGFLYAGVFLAAAAVARLRERPAA